jgi:hypothetical protein
MPGDVVIARVCERTFADGANRRRISEEVTIMMKKGERCKTKAGP